MAEQLVKLFGREIQKNLFPENEFYKQSKMDGTVNVDAAVIQIPQSGTVPTITKNVAVFPMTAVQRTDNVKEYNVDSFTTDPTLITDVNEIVTNYNKRADILQDHIDTLNARVAIEIGINWAPTLAPQKILTTGAASSNALAPGATGTRLAVTLEDFAALANMFDVDDVPRDQRNVLIPAVMMKQVIAIDAFISFDYANTKPVVSGQIGEIFGMKVFVRSTTPVYDASAAKKAFGAATAVTDNLGILAWANKQVRRAEGNVKIYADIDSPLYTGSIFNAQVRAGGTAGRTDEKGVYALIQG